MMQLTYSVNQKQEQVEIPNDTEFFHGEPICLSQYFDDLAKVMSFKKLRLGIEEAIKKNLLKKNTSMNLSSFCLEKYHNFVPSSQHEDIIKQARRLYPENFNFESYKIVNFIENILGVPLDYKNNISDIVQWIIVRINPPKSIGFNPVHKDVYEVYDEHNMVPKMINAWIPICGVNSFTGLPVVPGSHRRLHRENKERQCCGRPKILS